MVNKGFFVENSGSIEGQSGISSLGIAISKAEVIRCNR